MDSKQDLLWLQGNRRHTRSASNQEKEAKDKKAHESNDGESKKKETVTTGQIRGQNNEIIEYITEDGISYKVSDSAYVATERSDHPYSISTIQEIKPSKKDNAVVVLKWYYRPSEVPDSVYQMLVKERIDATEDKKEKEMIVDVDVRRRELFIADDDEVNQVFPVSALRGKCDVTHFENFQEVHNFEVATDNFFYVLGYNPNTRRLINIQGEVKVGSSHQWTATTRGVLYRAIIPDCKSLPQPSTERVNKDYEELVWEPRVNDCDLIMYLRSARSMAAFAGMCDGGSHDEGCSIASRDDTTINAFNLLFQCGGDVRMALQALVKKPLPLTVERKWTEDQVKRFQKGLRQNGKNFYKIRKDHLPNKETSELVEFYYLWKKVQDSLMVLPQSKLRRQAAMKRANKTSTPSAENGDVSSSENDSIETDDSGKDSLESPFCTNCHTTTSDDWDVGGKKSEMLCTKCRIKFKKYGVDTPLDIDLDKQTPPDFGETERRTPLSSLFPESSDIQPPFMFKPIKEKLKGSSEISPPREVDEDDQAQSPDVKRPKKRKWKKEEEQDEKMKSEEKRPKSEELSDNDGARLIRTPLASDSESSVVQERIKQDTDSLKSGADPKKASSSSDAQTHSSLTSTPNPPHPYHGGGDGLPGYHQNRLPLENRLAKTEATSGFPLASPMFHPPPRPVLTPHSFQVKQEVKPDYLTEPRTSLHPAAYSRTVPISTPDTIKHSPQLSSTSQSQLPLNNKDIKTSSNQHLAPTDVPPPPPRDHSKDVQLLSTPPSLTNQRTFQRRADQLNPNTDPKNCDVKTSISERSSPSDVVCIGEEHPPLDPPVLPEHHVTIPSGEPWPLRYKPYEDRTPDMDRSKNPVVAFAGQKIRLSSYPGFTCSRTDMVWIPPKPTNKPDTKQPSPPLKQASQSRPSIPSSKDKDIPRSKIRVERPASGSGDHVSVKRETPRPYVTGHMKPPSHHPSHGRLSTPLNIHTSSGPHDPSRSLPPHSSPFTSLGHPNPAISQFPNVDSLNREALSGLLAHGAQPHYPYLLAQQNEKDLRDRELREREFRERLLKPGMPPAKLFESLDSQATAAQAMALAGVHPSFHPSLVNQQVLDQIRQAGAVPGHVMGMPGASSLVPHPIAGMPPLLATNPELLQQNASEAERLALAQRIYAEQRNALEQQYRLDLLQNHQHSHVHSHLHLHPQNPPPPGGAVFPPPPVNDPLINQYAALAMQQNPALAGMDPAQVAAAVSMNHGMNLNQLRPPIAHTPGMPVAPPMLPTDPNFLISSQLHAAAFHENMLEQQRVLQQHQQHEMLMKMMSYAHKP